MSQNEMTYDSPANTLRRLREEKGFSLRRLAELTGLNYQTISRMERGQQIGLHEARQLALSLGVPARTFFPESDEARELVGLAEEVTQFQRDDKWPPVELGEF